MFDVMSITVFFSFPKFDYENLLSYRSIPTSPDVVLCDLSLVGKYLANVEALHSLIFLDLLDKCGCSSSVFTCSISNAALSAQRCLGFFSSGLLLQCLAGLSYNIEIKDAYIPPWIISSICATMGSEGGALSDHVSFRSPFPSPKVFRSTVSSLENPHRRKKPSLLATFFQRSPFSTPTIPSGAQGGDLQVFSKHRREILSHAPATRVSSPAA
ncbi:hypothetical protein CK203_042465 [Vitis vinifera]|uniref:Uncharacterized protein n=1 Tax=Vitis vinifera TaxID=29760 RepID=A0A438HES3_VITVI|nr:hypothetical protein CK203_042465 [Vitis vinifera]